MAKVEPIKPRINPSDDPLAFSYLLGDCEVRAAKAKANEFAAERHFKRTRQAVLIESEGKSAADREAQAANHPIVVERENEWIAARFLLEEAMGKRDAMRTVWDAWRSMESTRRAELQRGL